MRRLRLATLVATFVAVFAIGTSAGTAAPTELFFSEYIEGSSNNKALEIYNGTGSAADLAAGGYNVQMFFNGSASAGLTINLVGTVATGDVFVLAQSSASELILAQADQTNGAGWFNGNDAVVLRKGTTFVDVIGQVGFNPGTEWGTGLTSTADNTLLRKQSVEAGDANGSDAFDPAVEWDGFTVDTFGNLGSYGVPAPTINGIQGASHRSPLTGIAVIGVGGIVTAKIGNGFYLQDPSPDTDDSTSEGIFVFTSSAPTVNVGDAISVMGSVMEFRPGGANSTNLTTTELTGPTVVVQSTGNPLPAPIVIGTGGRVPPSAVIEDDATGDVETSGVFDPANDGIDFYESLEGMRVQVNDPQAVGPRNAFGEIPVVGDDGADASLFTGRGGLILRANDTNPERVILDDVIVGAAAMPAVDVGDGFTTDPVGVIDYSFGNFKLLVTEALTADSNNLTREATTAATAGQLAVATFNVENLDPTDPPAKFAALAALIVNNLRSPDLISVEEVQDDNGPTNDSVVTANATWNALIAAIQAAGGPTYQFRQVDPADDQDGGEPGGNIRQGFLFHTDRGLAFVDVPGAGATTPNSVVAGPHLQFSPGRIDPTNTAFANSRKPLAGEFRFHGSTLFVVGNHFNSKGGDNPLFGRFQPPVLASEPQRVQQAQVLNTFVDQILAQDASTNVIVLGDLNDFDWSTPLATLQGSPPVLSNLYATLPVQERYSYVFDGNSQALDHILVSSNLEGKVRSFDPVHVNAEFATRASDHDPLVARICVEERRRACP
jgi:predicted extracellular nuclease